MASRKYKTINVRDYGAVGNGTSFSCTASITSGSNALTVAGTTPFTSADAGKAILLRGAGTGNQDFATTIVSVFSSSLVQLGANAGTTLSSTPITIVYGHDDTTAISNALAAVPAVGGALYFPSTPGWYLTSSAISPTGKLGMSVFGDGWASTTIRSIACFDASDGHGVCFGSTVLYFDGSSSYVDVRNLTFDGGCGCRKAGQQAFNLSCSHLSVDRIRIINSGEYAFSLGRNGAMTDVQASGIIINQCYADGLNLYQVSNASLVGCIVDGADDDLLAITQCTDVAFTGLTLKARTDLTTTITGNTSITSGTPNLTVAGAAFTLYDTGKSISIPGAGAGGSTLSTTISAWVSATQVTLATNAGTTLSAVSTTVVYRTAWGRGLAILGGNTTIVGSNTIIDTVKQYGLFIASDGGARPKDINLYGTEIRNAATISGSGAYLKQIDDTTLTDLRVYNPAQGSCLLLADFVNLSVLGGRLTQSLSQFCRGIDTDSGGGYAAAWGDLTIKDVKIEMLGASTNEAVYLVPHTDSVTGLTSITSGAAVLTVVGGSFSSTDVGKAIAVPGAGPASVTLQTSIAAFTSATQVTLATNASTTLAAISKTVVYGNSIKNLVVSGCITRNAAGGNWLVTNGLIGPAKAMNNISLETLSIGSNGLGATLTTANNN